MAVNVPDHTADGKAKAAELRKNREYRLVGRIVADENRLTALKRRILHQLAHGAGLVDAGCLDFEDELAGQDFDRPARRRSADILDRRTQGIALVLGQNSRTELG